MLNQKSQTAPADPMKPALFRKEVADARASGLATHRLVMPLAYAANAALIATVATGLLLLLFFGRYTAKDTVRGYVTTTSGNVEVYASSAGTIRRLLVTEGQVVELGDTLVVVDAARATGLTPGVRRSISDALRAERGALLEQIEQEKQGFERRANGLRDERRALVQRQALLTEQAGFLQQRLAIATDENRRLGSLEARFASANDRDRARAAVIDRQVQVRELELLAGNNRAAIQSLEQRLAALPNEQDARTAELEAQAHRIARQIAEGEGRSVQRIVAPSSGIVSGLLVRRGQTVATSSPLMNIVPEDRNFYVELLIPTQTIAFIKPSAPVRIRYDAFPHQKFGVFAGVVANLTQTTVLPGDHRFRVPVSSPVYLARVQIADQQVVRNGETRAIHAGMTLTADVLRDERRIIEWLFDPLISAARRI